MTGDPSGDPSTRSARSRRQRRAEPLCLDDRSAPGSRGIGEQGHGRRNSDPPRALMAGATLPLRCCTESLATRNSANNDA
jgi:hypothetical protein